MAKSGKGKSHQRKHARKTAPVATVPPSIAEQVATILGREASTVSAGGRHAYAWASVPLAPLPPVEGLLDAAEEALHALLPPPGDVHSLAEYYALGYGVLGMASTGVDSDTVPGWLTSTDVPIDPFDVLFLGACWPGRFRDAAEFGNARDAWLHLLSGTRHGGEVARLVAAGLSVAEELELPLDDGNVLLGIALRVAQAGIGTQPLSAALMPRRALTGHRAVAGPPSTLALPALPPDADERLSRFTALMGSGLPPEHTASDALRAGLTLLVAALLSGATDLDTIAAASARSDDPAEAEAGITAAESLDEQLGAIDFPHTVVADRQEAVTEFLDDLPSFLLLPALALGVRKGAPPGEVVRDALPWSMGLLPPSGLVAVADVILVASASIDASAAVLLAMLLGMPEIDESFAGRDVEFHAEPGSRSPASRSLPERERFPSARRRELGVSTQRRRRC